MSLPRLAGRGLLVFLSLPLLYLFAAVVLGLVPVNRDFQPTAPAQGGVSVYLRTNGVHAELVVPARAPIDLQAEFPLAQVVDLARVQDPAALGWIAFGWGDRGFYLETPTWRDLRARTAAVALLGLGRGAMHVEYLARPHQYDAVRIDVNDAQYRALVEALRSGFRRGAGGDLMRIEQRGYFATDAFYEGSGRYTLWLTSNEWVRRVLATAGIRTALWAPFDVALFWHLR